MSLAHAMLRAGALGFSLPPLGLMRSLGSGLGGLAHCLDKRHRRIARDNLAASFPERDAAWVEATVKACYQHLGRVAMEIPRLLRYSRDQALALTRIMQPDNLAAVRRHLEAGRGVFVLTGHIGNWEWLNFIWGWLMGPSCVVARPIDWPPADRLVNQWRTRAGQEVVPKAASARRVLAHLRQGHGIGILLDQNVDWYDGVWVDFFGRPACTNKGLALLAMKTKAPVVPAWVWRGDDGKFELHVGQELPLVMTGDKTQDLWDNTQAYTKALEDIIRRRPEQWFWLHQRWKTKPYHLWPREQG